jgi:hypothetical protein
LVEVNVVIVKVVHIPASRIVESGAGQPVTPGVIVEEKILIAAAAVMLRGLVDASQGVGDMKIWQAFGAVMHEGGQGKHIEIALEYGDVGRAVTEGDRIGHSYCHYSFFMVI